jgi:resorcinol 4-hydroxylase (NADPH)
MHKTTDVIVVGAGPVGLVLSLLLSKEGHTVVLVERHKEPYPQPRAIGMSHESVRALQAAGASQALRDALFWDERQLRAGFVKRSGEVLMELQFRRHAESGGPEGQSFNQPDLEASLWSLVATQPNIQFMRGRVVCEVRQDAAGAEVDTVAADGTGTPLVGSAPETLRARYVVGSDGANSFVRRSMDAPSTDLGFVWDWLVVDIRPTVEREWKPYFGQVLGPPRSVTCAPAGPGRRRFEFMVLEGEERTQMSQVEVAWQLLREWDVHPANAELVRHAVYRFKSLWVDRWRKGRLLLAGDAAHLTPPFLGQGMNAGVRDAVTLAWRLSLVLRDLAPIESLDDYCNERLPHVRAQIEEAVQIGRMLCLTDPQECEERDGMLRFFRENPEQAPTQMIWRLGPGALAEGDPHAGTLGWQGVVRVNGRQGPFDDVCGANRFVLLGRSGVPTNALSPAARSAWERLGGIAVHVSPDGPVEDVEGTYARYFAQTGSEVVLLRPDFYVFGVGHELKDADRLVLELSQKLQLGTSN